MEFLGIREGDNMEGGKKEERMVHGYLQNLRSGDIIGKGKGKEEVTAGRGK